MAPVCPLPELSVPGVGDGEFMAVAEGEDGGARGVGFPYAVGAKLFAVEVFGGSPGPGIWLHAQSELGGGGDGHRCGGRDSGGGGAAADFGYGVGELRRLESWYLFDSREE